MVCVLCLISVDIAMAGYQGTVTAVLESRHCSRAARSVRKNTLSQEGGDFWALIMLSPNTLGVRD